VASTYFETIEGVPIKSGYAPIVYNGRTIGAVAVEASAHYFARLRDASRSVFLIFLMGILIVVLLAALFSNSIVAPLRALSRGAMALAEGNYQVELPRVGGNEIGVLAQSFREMRDQVLTREREMSMMLQGVAHEVRNPLAGMKLYVEILREELKRSVIAEKSLRKIEKEIDYIERVIQDFVNYSKQDPVRALSLEEIDVEAYVADLMELFSSAIQEMNIVVRVELKGPRRAVFDPSILRTVLHNIIKNAIQSIREKGRSKGQLFIRWLSQDGEYGFEVVDNGKGFSQDDVRIAFTPFFSTKQKGLGLGLSISQKLMASHMGRIEVTRPSGFGACVRVWFAQDLSHVAVASREGRRLGQVPLPFLKKQTDERDRHR